MSMLQPCERMQLKAIYLPQGEVMWWRCTGRSTSCPIRARLSIILTLIGMAVIRVVFSVVMLGHFY